MNKSTEVTIHPIVLCKRSYSSHSFPHFVSQSNYVDYSRINDYDSDLIQPSDRIALLDSKMRKHDYSSTELFPPNHSTTTFKSNKNEYPLGKMDDVLSQSLDLTENIIGLYAIELWKYNETSGKLCNVDLNLSTDEEMGQLKSSLLIKHITEEADHNSTHCKSMAEVAFLRLVDSSRKDYLPPTPVEPGVGLPGILWSESSFSPRRVNRAKEISLQRGLNRFKSVRKIIGDVSSDDSDDLITWREVDTLASDPDQVWSNRITK
mmetsp:Transcript_17649/g.36840  ORF Transcript_17649/g.36840 Transcript_17649/m.36840 type:complete len:263 (+) Transcript_17649:320-1108(+)